MKNSSAISGLFLRFVESLHKEDIPSEKLCQILCEALELKAASHYSRTSNGDLVLKAQYGLSYELYEDFEVNLNTPVGMALKSPAPLLFSDVRTLENYRDKGLIEKFSLKSLVITRIENPGISGVSQQTLGALCMYPKHDDHATSLAAEVTKSMQAISYFISGSLKSECHTLRGDIVSRAAFSADLNSFLHRSLRVLVSRWNIGAASVYFHDDEARVLRLRATTGLKGRRRRNDVFLRDDDELSPIVDAFQKRRTIEDKDAQSNQADSIIEAVDGKVRTTVDVPIFEPTGPRQNVPTVIGVLRVINKSVKSGALVRQMSFGWDDLFILRYACELFGVIGNLHKRIDSTIENLNRTFHGIGNNIHGLEANLSVLQSFDVMRHVPYDYAYLLDDSLAFVESLNAQIDRFEIRTKYQDRLQSPIHEVSLAGEVIAPLPRYAKAVARLLQIDQLHLDISAFVGEKMREIPRVKGDPDYYLIVFKNIIENAIKYCGGTSCSITFAWKSTSEEVVVHVADKGLGISAEDRDVIFREGVRGSRASEASALGAGMGLFHCVELLEQFHAHLSLLDIMPDNLKDHITCFELRFPVWEPQHG